MERLAGRGRAVRRGRIREISRKPTECRRSRDSRGTSGWPDRFGCPSTTKVAVRLCWWHRCRWPPANAVMPLPCQPAARSRPLVTTWCLIRPNRVCSPRVGLALLPLIVLLILAGRSRAASSQPATRYASRIVETKSGQIRGILQVCIDSSC